MKLSREFLCGVALAVGGRALVEKLLLWQFRRNLRSLNAGDYRPLLAFYAEDAVLHFNDGEHRWAGQHRGRAAIERFLQEFVNAGLQGELEQIWISGPPWALTMAARFNDQATALQVIVNNTTQMRKVSQQVCRVVSGGRK